MNWYKQSNFAQLSGNEKRFLATPPTKVVDGKTYIVPRSDQDVKLVKALEAKGYLYRPFPSATFGFWLKREQ